MDNNIPRNLPAALYNHLKPMLTPLLSTKYHLPPAAHNWVQRTRLLARLDELLLPGKRLGLISALAGSGKTTLVRSWAEQNNIPNKLNRSSRFRVAWLSLDEGDNDLAVFLAYLITALETACPEIDLEPISGFEPGGAYATPPMRLVLGNVINQLAELTEQIIMVFDDYHTISVTAIHEAFTYLIDHLPDSARLVMITRAESLLPISRLRARGQLVEIREADLRFSTAESAEFLNETTGLNLSLVEIEQLVERTEGWAAGLQLAALALRALPDASARAGEFVQTFSASNRFVLDYLMDEIFSGLSAQTRSFLLETAALDRFCADLCRAVIGRSRVELYEPVEGQLSTLSQSNLFIIPLDEERTWYRYHHLFADLVRNRLRQESTPEEIAERQRRAGAWFDSHGLAPEAIHYLLLAGDSNQAADLIEACAQDVISSGRLVTLSQWLAELPADVLAMRPRLRIFQALTSFLKGDSATAINILEDTEKKLGGVPESGNTQKLKRELISILAMSNIAGASSERVLSLVQDALDSVPESEPIPRARLLFAQGIAYAMSSDKRYYILVKQAMDLARQAGNLYLAANILNMQAMGAVFFQAQYHTAWQLCAEIIQLCLPTSGERLPLAAALGYVGQAAIALEWDDLEEAERLLGEGVELSSQGGQESPSLSALLVQARLAQAKGDLAAARDALETAASKHSFDDNIAAVAQLAQAQVRLYLASGQIEIARQCAAGEGLPPTSQPHPGLPTLVREVWSVLQARVLVERNLPAEALALVEPVITQAMSAGRMARVIEGSLCQAVALHSLHRDALGPLQQALSIAFPQRVTRVFIEAGQPLCDLLVAYRTRLGNLSTEAERLLSLLGGTASLPPPVTAELVESLTKREMDVLRLLCAGLSNQEIAETLYLSLSAVKKYSGNVYGKLGVTSRAQAIVKARELRLV